jgi:hypothetical protein
MERSQLNHLVGGRRYVYRYVSGRGKTYSENTITGTHLRTTRQGVWFLAANGAIRKIGLVKLTSVT